jgi:hypothetical protein
VIAFGRTNSISNSSSSACSVPNSVGHFGVVYGLPVRAIGRGVLGVIASPDDFVLVIEGDFKEICFDLGD